MARKIKINQQRAIILIVLCGFIILGFSQLKFSQSHTATIPVNTAELSQQIKEHPLLFFQTIDLNTATAEELTAIPRIGPVLAGRIINFRTANGSFKDISELKQVQGIGEKTVLRLQQYLHI